MIVGKNVEKLGEASDFQAAPTEIDIWHIETLIAARIAKPQPVPRKRSPEAIAGSELGDGATPGPVMQRFFGRGLWT
jgi:hypothetical protein